MNPPPRRAAFGCSDILMVAVTVSWGLNFSIVKISLREMTPGGFNGLRLILTALILAALMAVRGERWRVARGDLWRLAVLGVLSHAFYQILFINGLNRTSASNSSFILAFSPIIVALLGGFLRIERIHWSAWLGILISAAGLYLVISGRPGGIHLLSEGFRGDLLIFAGSILWAVNTVFSKEFLARMSPLKFCAITVGFGTLAYIPFTVEAMIRLPWARISAGAWGGLVYSAVFSLVLGYLVWYISVRRVGNARTAVYSNLTPVITALFAYLLLGESLRLSQIGGAAIILAGVYLTRAEYGFFLRGRNGAD